MLYWALIFFIVTILAALYGFTGDPSGATTIAQMLFILFLLLFLASLIMGLAKRMP